VGCGKYLPEDIAARRDGGLVSCCLCLAVEAILAVGIYLPVVLMSISMSTACVIESFAVYKKRSTDETSRA
jgi:hypothetical protein